MPKITTIALLSLASLAVVCQFTGFIGTGLIVFDAKNKGNEPKIQNLTYYNDEWLTNVVSALTGDIDVSVPRICASLSFSCQILGLVLFLGYIQAQPEIAYKTGLCSGLLLLTACIGMIVSMMFTLLTDTTDTKAMLQLYEHQPWPMIYLEAIVAFLDFLLCLYVFRMACCGHNNENTDSSCSDEED